MLKAPRFHVRTGCFSLFFGATGGESVVLGGRYEFKDKIVVGYRNRLKEEGFYDII